MQVYLSCSRVYEPRLYSAADYVNKSVDVVRARNFFHKIKNVEETSSILFLEIQAYGLA